MNLSYVCALIFKRHIEEIIVMSIFLSSSPPPHLFDWLEQCPHSQDSFVIQNGPFSLSGQFPRLHTPPPLFSGERGGTIPLIRYS